MAFCDNCGHILRSTAKFCGSCGETVNANLDNQINNTGDSSNSDNRINNTSDIQQKTGIQTYQILSIIGGVLGLLITLAAAAALSFTSHMAQSFGGEGLADSESEYYTTTVGIAIMIYISCFIVPFVIKKAKIVGMYLLASSFVVLIATGLFGLLGFALLLPAGILALRHKS